MSFPNDVVIADAIPVNQTYSLISMNASKSVRSNPAKPVSEPCILTISHETIKKASKKHLRHLVRIDMSKLGTDGVTPFGAYAYLVLGHDDQIITETMLQDLIVQLKNFLVTANVTKLVHGEP